MREALNKAIALNPGYPESYSLLAMISLVRRENLEEGIANLNKAIGLSPGNQGYHLNLANLYLNLEQYDKAEPIIENIARTAEDPGMRAHAESMLNNIRFIKEQLAKAKAAGGDAKRGRVLITAEGNPPTDEEIAKLRDEAERDAILSSLREPKEGETRVMGYLSKIECPAGTIQYSIRVDGQILKLQSKDFQSLNVEAFGPSVDTEIGCGTIKKEFYAILTYIPKENPKTKTKGELVSIEIVPEGFKL